ncbi:MAG: tRNA pseudouridine(38-40) synthase TruA [Muribaculaceae bacterium]|nr:tRNA pseudouridine(38-40) synthase TruA [Muribaculaceae bacterium]
MLPPSQRLFETAGRLAPVEQRPVRRRWFMDLSFRGAPFHGWQSQPNAVSVQSVVEEALATVLRHPVPVTGAGRTDAGVNARRMVAHFDTEGALPDVGKMLVSLNRLVGRDISIRSIREVFPESHARFDALSRTYKYFVLFEKSPFFHALSWHCPHPLDIEAMNSAAMILPLTTDFTSFAKLHSDARTNICHVTRAQWEPIAEEGRTIGTVFTITADRFLRNMVRAIVGTLVDAGRHKLAPHELKAIIDAKDRCSAGQSMPGEALYLWDVTYSPHIYLP